MPKYKLVVLTAPVEGRGDEFNDWYQGVHLADVVDIDGITSAQRFRFVKSVQADKSYPYLAIYEVETDDVDAVLKELNRRRGTDRMQISEALGPDIYAVVYEEFGPAVSAK